MLSIRNVLCTRTRIRYEYTIYEYFLTAGSPVALDESSSMPSSDTAAQPAEEPSKSSKKSKEKSHSKDKAEKKSSILSKFAGRSKAFFSYVLSSLPNFTDLDIYNIYNQLALFLDYNYI